VRRNARLSRSGRPQDAGLFCRSATKPTSWWNGPRCGRPVELLALRAVAPRSAQDAHARRCVAFCACRMGLFLIDNGRLRAHPFT